MEIGCQLFLTQFNDFTVGRFWGLTVFAFVVCKSFACHCTIPFLFLVCTASIKLNGKSIQSMSWCVQNPGFALS